MRKSCLFTVIGLIIVVASTFLYTAWTSFAGATGETGDGNPIVYSRNPASPSTKLPASTPQKLKNTCNDLQVLVDRTHSLPQSYIPADLVYLKDFDIPVNNYTLRGRHVMINDLQKLIANGVHAGFYLIAASVYRSYDDQSIVYNNYVRDYGEEQAHLFSARPGQSQHQLGTAIDFTTAEMDYRLAQNFASTGAGVWLLANAYKYGFYLSYPEGKENVTGYAYEPWHFRYIGVQNARNLQQSGLIMQTYLDAKAIAPYC